MRRRLQLRKLISQRLRLSVKRNRFVNKACRFESFQNGIFTLSETPRKALRRVMSAPVIGKNIPKKAFEEVPFLGRWKRGEVTLRDKSRRSLEAWLSKDFLNLYFLSVW